MFDDLIGTYQGAATWTVQFTKTECMTDSDGDGESNGEELGIDCEAVPFAIIPDTTNADVTHPGTL